MIQLIQLFFIFSMKPKTINKLNQLNKNFYQQTASSFNQSRQYYWRGWHRLWQLITNNQNLTRPLSVLDLGCGNGRFAQFLLEQDVDFEYTGVDNNQQLLDIADNQLNKLQDHKSFKHIDLVAELNANNLIEHFQQKFNVIVGFGLIHHIPSFDLRFKLIASLQHLLQKQGLLVLTAWQFAQDPRYHDRHIKPDKVGVKQQDLEKNDFILDWRKGRVAYRYCHFVDKAELKQINQQLEQQQSPLIFKSSFAADGKSDKLNRYLIWQKSA